MGNPQVLKVEHEYFLPGEDLSLTGGELILAVARIYSGSFGSNPDLARLNLLLFLIEGDGGIASNLMYTNTPFGPKSNYIVSFISENPGLIRGRSYGKKAANTKLDPDVRRKVELTAEGVKIADRAIASLSSRETKKISQILSKWGREKHSEILMYLCIFYKDFCSEIDTGERHRDGKD